MLCFYNRKIIESRILKMESSSGIYANLFSLRFKKRKKKSEPSGVLLEVEQIFFLLIQYYYVTDVT